MGAFHDLVGLFVVHSAQNLTWNSADIHPTDSQSSPREHNILKSVVDNNYAKISPEIKWR